MIVKELKNILKRYDDNAPVELSIKESVNVDDWSWFELNEYKFTHPKTNKLDKSHLLLSIGDCTME